MESTSRKVIEYIGDSINLEATINKIGILNAQLAKSMGDDFGKVAKVINQKFSRVKDVTIIDKDGVQKSVKALEQLDTVVQTTSGNFVRISQLSDDTDGKLKQISTTVSDVTSQYNKLQTTQSGLIGQSSQLSTNFNNVADVSQKFSNELKVFGGVSSVVGRNIAEVSGNTTNLGMVVKDSNGKFIQLTETITRTPEGLQLVSRSAKDVSNQFMKTAVETAKMDKNSVSLGENITRLVKRAALTIPVWFALRQGVGAVMRTFRDGLKDIVEFDKALQKLKRNISATSSDLEKDFGIAKDSIVDFSIKSGRSVEEITNAIQKFATVGFTIEESLSGGIDSMKLAVLLFGEGEETANAFARSIRVLTENITDTEQKQRLISEALALTDKLWKTNAFEVNEFSGNLEKFAGTANIANMSISDTLALLATLSTGGLTNRAGQLLRSTLLKSLSQIDKINTSLNLGFDPSKQTTIEFITLLVDKLKEIKTVDNVPAELADTLGELFSVRGTEVVAALVSLQKTLKENLAMRPDLKEFNNEFNEQTNTINRLVDRYHNLNKEIGRTFIEGLTGGENFVKSLEKIVNFQQKLLDDTPKIGDAFKNAFIAGGVISVIALNKEILASVILMKTKMIPLIALLKTEFSALSLSVQAGLAGAAVFTILSLNDQAKRLEKDGKDLIKKANEIGQEIGDNIVKGLKGQLTGNQLSDLLITLETFGAKELGWKSEELQKTVDLLKQRLEIEKQIAEVQAIQESNTNNEKKVAPIILQHKLEQLKTQGALNSEILKATTLWSKQLKIGEESIDLLTRQLEAERSINEEKRLQSRLGADSIKLFKIAQEYGVNVAKQIGDVMAGETDFSQFIKKGGQAAEVFTNQFSDLFEAKQAEQFFTGQRVSTVQQKGTSGFNFDLFSKGAKDLSQLRGGQGIAIQEEAIRGIDTTGIRVDLLKAIQDFERIEKDRLSGDVTISSPANVSIVGLGLENLYTQSKSPIIGNVKDTTGIDLIARESARNINERLTGVKQVLPQTELFRNAPQGALKTEINFGANSFSIVGGTKEEQLKAIEESFSKMATPGTPENKKLQKALFGTNQTI